MHEVLQQPIGRELSRHVLSLKMADLNTAPSAGAWELLCSMHQLERLKVTGRAIQARLVELTGSISRLSSLKCLHIDYASNDISLRVTSAVASLPHLIRLTIGGAAGNVLHAIRGSPSLQELHLLTSRATIDVPDSFSDLWLPKLSCLELSGLALDGAIHRLTNLHGLQELICEEVAFVVAGDDGAATAFWPLKASLTGLTSLTVTSIEPAWVPGGWNAAAELHVLTALQVLCLVHIGMSTFSAPAACTSLRHLDVSNNRLTTVSDVSRLLSLTSLDASGQTADFQLTEHLPVKPPHSLRRVCIKQRWLPQRQWSSASLFFICNALQSAPQPCVKDRSTADVQIQF